MSVPVSKGGSIIMLIFALIFLIPALVIVAVGGGSNQALGAAAILALPGVFNLIQYFRILYKLDKKEKIMKGLETLRQLQAEEYRREEVENRRRLLNDYFSTENQQIETINDKKKQITAKILPGNRCPFCENILEEADRSVMLKVIICPTCGNLVDTN